MLNTEFFHTAVPPRPMGRYAHIVMLRVTEGYAVFQTDGELNKARVTAGATTSDLMTRITLFKRKQTTPERLTGREILRNFGILSDSENEKDENSCIYNVKSCKQCPDCITYGFAIGDGGSEKSKIYTDTAFSLTDYANSHEVFTLNAPYEDGTMSDKGEVTSRINQQDHVKPQTIFPSVLTTRDLTANLFAYVLQNVLRTTRYGATTTRGGTMCNHIVAIVLSDGEIFSNLLFTQRLYDALGLTRDQTEPVDVATAIEKSNQIIPELLHADNVQDQQVLMGNDLVQFLDSVRSMDRDAVGQMLSAAGNESRSYYDAYIARKKK
jgi:CRISPR-associated protein Csc2